VDRRHDRHRHATATAIDITWDVVTDVVVADVAVAQEQVPEEEHQQEAPQDHLDQQLEQRKGDARRLRRPSRRSR